MKKFLVSSFVLLVLTFGANPSLFASSVSNPILLWPNGVPDHNEIVIKEHDATQPKDRLVAAKRVMRMTDVSQPTITVYRPSKYKANGTAVIVCPGGGYKILAMDLEGIEVCHWLNSLGVTAALLKYRVPDPTNDLEHKLPLQDAQRALGLVRFHAREWNIDSKRVGIIGFSAGGHLAAHVSNDNAHRAYDTVDEADAISCRPDFAMLIYPGALVLKKPNSQLSPELNVTSNAPPTLLVQAEDDPVRVENSLYYFLALKNAKVPAEMHLYAKGGHGYGLRPSKDTVSTWPKRAEDWLRHMGMLSKKHS